jgi:hypothetical protein
MYKESELDKLKLKRGKRKLERDSAAFHLHCFSSPFVVLCTVFHRMDSSVTLCPYVVHCTVFHLHSTPFFCW